MTGGIESAVEQALVIAESLPEMYQELALREILRHVLGKPSSPDGAVEMPATGERASSSGEQDLQSSGIPCAADIAQKGTRDQQAVWAVIRLCSEGKEATTASVRALIKDSLCMPEHVSATSHTLSGLVPEYLTRGKREKGTRPRLWADIQGSLCVQRS